MDKAEVTMHQNLHKNTGKTLVEWIALVKKENFEKHGQILKFLKEQHAFTHGFANLVALKAQATDAGSVKNKDELIEKQYNGKEHFRPLYNRLITEIKKLGDDVEIAPKNTYVSIKRKKQFAILQPVTKTKFELGLNLKGQAAAERLEIITASNAMCSHKINLAGVNEVDALVLEWLKTAYDKAG